MTKSQLIHASKSCGGVYNTLWNDSNLPYLECEKCGHKLMDWVKWHSEYSGMWKDPVACADVKNSVVCLLGFFCARYKESYDIEYNLSLNSNGLFRGPESTFIRRILAFFDSDYARASEYIDWVFKTKIEGRKKRITSLSYLTTQEFVQHFKFDSAKRSLVTRSTKLPEKMVEWVKQKTPALVNKISLDDFGDLHSFLSHYRTGFMQEDEAAVRFVQKLYKCNYIDNDLNIKNWRDA